MGESRNLRIWLTFLALAATVLLCREDITAGIQRFFSDPEVVSFLLYLETGKAIHVSGQWEETAPPTLPAIPEETAEATQPTQGPAEQYCIPQLMQMLLLEYLKKASSYDRP